MSSLYPNGPASRLLCSACRLTIETPLVVLTRRAGYRISCDAQGKRQYATKRLKPLARTAKPPSPKTTAPSSSPAPTHASSVLAQANHQSGKGPVRLLFSVQDIPPLKEWVNGLEAFGNKDLTPMECVDGARRYISIATQYENQWRPKLEKEHNLSPFMLHWIGILLLAGNTPARWRLGTHMLRSASELGYVPSTLSLVRTFRSMPPHMFDRAANSLMYREANARFQKVVQAGTDPDALTLQGLIHARSVDEGKDVKALAAFNQATLAWQKRQHEKGNLDEETEAVAPGKGIQAAVATSKSVSNSEAVDAPAGREFVLPPPRKPRWDWEVSCVLEQAYILERTQGTTAEALRLFRVAALELDNPFGFLMLAKLMDGPRNSPERRTYLLKAAISGVPEACREIGELEALDAARQDLSQNERAEHHKLSKEWFRLAEGEDMASWIKDNIGNGDVKE